MNIWKKRRSFAALVALVVLTLLVTFSTEARAQATAVDPAAVQTLKRMTDFLDGLKQFSVNAQVVVEEMHVSGHRVDYDMSANTTIKRPNKMRAVRTGGLGSQRFYYDGKTMTSYNPDKKIYATEKAPDTIEKVITFARETAGVLLPAADMIYRNAFPLMMQDVRLAVVVGKAVVGGVRCDHLLFSRPEVDFQVWVAEGKEPFPRKYVVTETATPQKLAITAFLNNWNITSAVDDAQFKFVPPKGTQAMTFSQLEKTRGNDR